MADDKKKQAMSLLFGDAPPKPKRARRPAQPDDLTAPTVELIDQSRSATATSGATSATSRPEEALSASIGPEATSAVETPDPYYEGQSRYRRRDGTEVKHSIYLDEEVSRALKMAAARGDDPRGTSMSAIVNQALSDLGYR